MEEDQEWEPWISVQGALKAEIDLAGQSHPRDCDAELQESYDWRKLHRQMFVRSVELVLRIAARGLTGEREVSLRVIVPPRRQQSMRGARDDLAHQKH